MDGENLIFIVMPVVMPVVIPICLRGSEVPAAKAA